MAAFVGTDIAVADSQLISADRSAARLCIFGLVVGQAAFGGISVLGSIPYADIQRAVVLDQGIISVCYILSYSGQNLVTGVQTHIGDDEQLRCKELGFMLHLISYGFGR